MAIIVRRLTTPSWPPCTHGTGPPTKAMIHHHSARAPSPQHASPRPDSPSRPDRSREWTDPGNLLKTHGSALGKLGLLMACLAGTGLPRAVAGTMESIAMYAQYKALAQDPKYLWAGAVTGRRGTTGEIVTASCVAIAPTVVLGAGHVTPGPTSLSVVQTVTFGPNYKSGDKLVMDVIGWEQFPGYSYTDKSTPDLGVYYLKKPIPNFTPIQFGDSQIGDIHTQVDFGNYGDTTVGELPSLGDKLAGNAQHIYYSLPSIVVYPVTKYSPLSFNGDGVTQRTQGLEYSSGSPWFSADGKVTHLSVARINGMMDNFTICLKLNTEEVQNWLQPKIQASWAAMPGTYQDAPLLEISRVPAGGFQLSWGDEATGFVLERSSDFTAWEGVGPVRFGAGNHVDAGEANRRFFRMRKAR